MILKILKFLWFISLLVVLGMLLYAYASMQQEVNLFQKGMLSKESFFYAFLFFLAGLNVFIFLIKGKRGLDDVFQTWFFSMVIFSHVFLVEILAMLVVLNSGERYDYTGFGKIFYGSVVALALGFISLPLYRLYIRISPAKRNE